MKNKTNQPLISVVMPVYNAEKYLKQAIQSILAQTYQNFEFIIVNDRSTDKSREIIQKYQKKYPRKIRFIDLKRNLNKGGDASANIGLKHAKGKYIARMDADDIACSTRLKKQVAYLDSHPEVFLVGSNAYVIDKSGKKIGEKLVPENTIEILKACFTFHPIIHPSSMFRRIINKKKFLYPIKYSANNDYYTFFKLICQGYKFVNLEEKLLKYRIHNHNATFVDMRKQFVNTLKIRLSIVSNYKYKPSIKNIAMLIAQSIVALTLPENMLLKIYFLAKGFIKKEELIASFNFAFVRKFI